MTPSTRFSFEGSLSYRVSTPFFPYGQNRLGKPQRNASSPSIKFSNEFKHNLTNNFNNFFIMTHSAEQSQGTDERCKRQSGIVSLKTIALTTSTFAFACSPASPPTTLATYHPLLLVFHRRDLGHWGYASGSSGSSYPMICR